MTDYSPAGHSIAQVKFKDLDIEAIVAETRERLLKQATKRADQAAAMARGAVLARELKNIEKALDFIRAEHARSKAENDHA